MQLIIRKYKRAPPAALNPKGVIRIEMPGFYKNGGPGAAGNHHRIAIIFSPQTPQSAILLGKTARWRRHFYFALHFSWPENMKIYQI